MEKMSAILMNDETGDLVLDENNYLIPVDTRIGFQQIIDGLFHCDLESEIMNQAYGFDLKRAIRESHHTDAEMFIESLVLQALDEKNERLISEVNYIQATRSGRSMTVNLIITSILDETIELEETIGG